MLDLVIFFSLPVATILDAGLGHFFLTASGNNTGWEILTQQQSGHDNLFLSARQVIQMSEIGVAWLVHFCWWLFFSPFLLQQFWMPKCPWERAFSKATCHFPVGPTVFAAENLKAKIIRRFYIIRHFFLYVEEKKIEDLIRSVWNWIVVAMSKYVCSGCSELRPPCFVSTASTWNPASD